ADAEPARIAGSIEVPRGPVVATLLERGFHVFAINPKQLDRFRDRHSPAGAKDDRRDGFVLADSLRTDRPAFRQVHVDDPLLIQLRELSRAEEELQTELRRLSNRLWEQLQRFHPQVPRRPRASTSRCCCRACNCSTNNVAGVPAESSNCSTRSRGLTQSIVT